jgi:hypothetical protein
MDNARLPVNIYFMLKIFMFLFKASFVDLVLDILASSFGNNNCQFKLMNRWRQ